MFDSHSYTAIPVWLKITFFTYKIDKKKSADHVERQGFSAKLKCIQIAEQKVVQVERFSISLCNMHPRKLHNKIENLSISVILLDFGSRKRTLINFAKFSGTRMTVRYFPCKQDYSKLIISKNSTKKSNAVFLHHNTTRKKKKLRKNGLNV